MPKKPVGLHVHSRRADDLVRRYIEAVHPTVMKWLAEGASPELVELAKAHGALTICRPFNPSQNLWGNGPKEMLDLVEDAIARYPQFDAYEGFNEAFQRIPDIRERVHFELALMKLCKRHGKRAVIGSFSVGQPQWPATGHPDDWEAYATALEYAGRHGHLLGLHEYGAPAMQWGVGANQASALEGGRWVAFDECERPGLDGWFVLRYRKAIRHWRALGLDPLPKIVITESGLDDIQPRPSVGRRRGYKTYQGTEWWDHPVFGGYAKQLAWACRRWAEDPLVVGGVDFGFADVSGDWDDFDLSTDPETLEQLMVEMAMLPDAPDAPESAPPPAAGGKQYRSHVVQQGDTLWGLAGGRWHELQRVVPMGDPRELAVGATIMIPEDIER